MSRRQRDGRYSESRHHLSGFDREPSPKKSRRDGKPDTERAPSNTDLGSGDHPDRDRKNHRRLQDALPLETPSAPDSKVESSALNKESDKKPDGDQERSKFNSNPTEVPRSRSYYQHDERGNAGQVRRSFGRRAADDRQWKDSKDDQHEREKNRSATYDLQRREEGSQVKGHDSSVWRHDDFFKMETKPAPPARKRPAFREKKIPVDSENSDKAATGSVRPGGRSDYTMSTSERREERDRNPRYFDRSERPVAGDRVEAPRSGLPSRERYGVGVGVGAGAGAGNYKGRDRFNGRQSYNSGGTRGDKWKHDLFDDANRSPTTKNEEDQIAMVEALLSS